MKKASVTLTNGETIEYQLEHRPRKTVGLKITDDGLVVFAPKRIFNFQLQKVLTEKSSWIINKLAARKQNHVSAINWQNGETLRLLDKPVTLRIEHNVKNKQPQFNLSTLSIALPKIDDEAAIEHKVVQWYKKQALTDFGRRLEILAAKLDVPTPLLKLSNAKARWGSCNSHGDIRLNWRLIQAPPHIINYVICHELAHLKEMNHSARFWAVVASLYPDYKAAEKELKSISIELHRL